MQRNEFDDVVRTKSKATQKAPIIGRVSKVFEKEDNKPETGNIEVNVQTVAVDHEFRRVPVVATDHPGHTFVPQKDDYVVVDFTQGNGTEPIVVGASPTKNNRAPNARAGHWRHEWGDGDERLYLEAEPGDSSAGTPELIRLAVKQDGLTEPLTELVLDKSGDSHTIKADVGDDAQELRLDNDDGSFKLSDDDGFGIASNGDGRITVSDTTTTDSQSALVVNMDGSGHTIKADVGNDEQGLLLDNSDGSFTLLDAGGFGIESDGSGNFTWYMNSLEFDDQSGPTTLE